MEFWILVILDFGDFGFWILGILDFGFGLGILDGHLVTKFWMLHKKRRLCTPNRVGGFSGWDPKLNLLYFPLEDDPNMCKGELQN